PSGAALAIAATPVRPPMPPLFSITTCWPSTPDMPPASRRPNMSEGPPAANGTYRVIGLFGQVSARALVDATTAAAPAPLRIVLRFIVASYASHLGQTTHHDGNVARHVERLLDVEGGGTMEGALGLADELRIPFGDGLRHAQSRLQLLAVGHHAIDEAEL